MEIQKLPVIRQATITTRVDLRDADPHRLDQPGLAKLISNRGTTKAVDFYWDRVADNMESVYLDMLVRNTGR